MPETGDDEAAVVASRLREQVTGLPRRRVWRTSRWGSASESTHGSRARSGRSKRSWKRPTAACTRTSERGTSIEPMTIEVERLATLDDFVAVEGVQRRLFGGSPGAAFLASRRYAPSSSAGDCCWGCVRIG